MKIQFLKFVIPANAMVMAAMLTISLPAQAQKGKKGKAAPAAAAQAQEPKKKNDIATFTKGMLKSEGLFTMYRDTAKGTVYMAINPEQLEKEYIYFSFVADGVADAGFFRGSYRGSRIITFGKSYNRISVTGENTRFYFDEDNALSRAAGANINKPVLASLEIKANDPNGRVLVDGTALFTSEDIQMIKPPTPPGQNSVLGKLSKEKTTIDNIRNYPENSDVVVSYVYENPNPTRYGSEAITDPRNITIRYQHSLIAVPENDYQPRRDDPRIGYFSTQVNDMTTIAVTNYRDVIHRWHLVKKDPDAPLSDPVEPIVFWIENTTPQAFRPIIQAAGERWNMAFEKAGFTNAIVVKEQPDTAHWDAGDIRYNVLRWTSSPQPPFGGYGPSFVNPRTGQIIGADIMLEFSAVSRRLFRKEVFEKAGYLHSELFAEAEMLHQDHSYCMAGDLINHGMVFGTSAMRIQNLNEAAEDQFVRETLGRLILHEIGHTLGLSHNMHASTMLSPEDLRNKAVVDQHGLCSSVMEYPAINYPSKPQYLTKYYDDNPGPYDLWAIEYGYSPSLPDAAAEEARLQSILARSTEWQLAFGNDADDMRAPGKGINPNVNIYDLSNDPVAYAVERIDLVNELLKELTTRYATPGGTWEELLQAFLTLSGEYGNQLSIISKQIGGVYVNRALAGQEGSGADPFEPVPAEKQKAAMDALAKYAFAPNALNLSAEVYRHLQQQRRGFNHPSTGEDPKIHARNLAFQKGCLEHLLHHTVLERMVNSALYGNTYTLDRYMTDLTDAIFKADLTSRVNTTRQNLQVEYTQRLAQVVGDDKNHSHVARSMALHELKRIDRMAQANPGSDTPTRAHRDHLRQVVKKTLEN